MASTTDPSRQCTARCRCGFARLAGSLADEENGSLFTASIAELYSTGRLNFHSGMTVHSHARALAVSAEAAAERSALSLGHTPQTFANVSDMAKAAKVLEYLAGCRWPSRLDHWRVNPFQLMADMNDLFLYKDCGGLGKTAESTRFRSTSRPACPTSRCVERKRKCLGMPPGRLVY